MNDASASAGHLGPPPVLAAPPADLRQAIYVLWSDALPLADRVRDDLRRDCRILADTRITWSAEMVQGNLRRIYRRPSFDDALNDVDRVKGSGREIHVFHVEARTTNATLHRSVTGQIERVNGLFPVKKDLYRTWAEDACGGFPFLVHCAASFDEVRLLTVLLFGCDTATALWRGDTLVGKSLHQDLVGAHGWPSLADALTALTHCVDWCILRGWENSPEHFKGDDLDLLVADRAAAASLLGLQHRRADAHMRSGVLGIGDSELMCDLHWPGDGYLDPVWEKKILENRIADHGWYRPDDEDALFSLIYGEYVHRRRERPEKVDRIRRHARRISHTGWLTPELFGCRSQVLHTLAGYMAAHGYAYVRPRVQRYAQAADAVRVLTQAQRPAAAFGLTLLLKRLRRAASRVLPPTIGARIEDTVRRWRQPRQSTSRPQRPHV